MNNDSVYRWLTSIKCTFHNCSIPLHRDYSHLFILMLVASFIALNFIAYKFHFCNFWQPFVFLTYKVCGNMECWEKKIFSCTRYCISKNKKFEMWNARFRSLFRAYICVDWSFGMVSKISDAWKVHNEKFDIFFSDFFTDSSVKKIKILKFHRFIPHYDDWFCQQFYPF